MQRLKESKCATCGNEIYVHSLTRQLWCKECLVNRSNYTKKMWARRRSEKKRKELGIKSIKINTGVGNWCKTNAIFKVSDSFIACVLGDIYRGKTEDEAIKYNLTAFGVLVTKKVKTKVSERIKESKEIAVAVKAQQTNTKNWKGEY